MIRIAVAEDKPFLAKSLEEKISIFNDLKYKFKAENGKELINNLEKNLPIDLILMDIQMPEMDGIEATSIIKEKYPNIKILMLTVFDDEETIFNAILAGADGYLLKDESAQTIYKSINETVNGGASMSPTIALKALKLLRNPLNTKQEEIVDYQLSPREIEILEQIGKGLSYMHISQNLYISSGTVRKHTENIYKKLQVHSKLEAVDLARKNRIIE